MADNVILTNQKTTFEANSNNDIQTRTTEKSGKHVQHVVVDWGGSSAESLTTPDFATETTLASIDTKTSLLATESTLSSINSKLATGDSLGFFGSVLTLLRSLIEYLRMPSFAVPLAGGIKVQAILATDSAINTVSTVSAVTTCSTVTNLTNMNTIDSRELVWAMWMNVYNEGIRSKIN